MATTRTRLVDRLAASAGLMPRVLLTLLALCVGRSGLAQVEPVEPRWMVVTRETPMRCGELTTFYKVADLKPATVVRVDAVSPRWARLVYPSGQHAFVAVSDAVNVTETELSLAPSARVRSPNAISGLPGSWRSLYLGDLASGARLRIVGKAEARDGQVVGYQVDPPTPPVAPHPPYGYAELSALRDATPAEVSQHVSSLESATARPAPDTPVSTPPATPSATPAGGSDPGAGSDPAAGAAAEVVEPPATPAAPAPAAPTAAAPSDPPAEAAKTDTSLVAPMVLPGQEPTPTPESASAPAGEAEPAEAATPAPPPAETAPVEAGPTHLGWNELESTLSRVRRAGGSVLEDALDELIAEYERTRDATESVNVRRAIDARLDWLDARRDVRDERLALDAAVVEAAKLRESVGERVRAWESARGYDIIGRLMPSTVYDGRRLPRMFRVQAVRVDGLTRTIGYILDTDKLDLEPMLGQVVGVVGDARLDPALRLRVITPTRVARLEPVPAGG